MGNNDNKKKQKSILIVDIVPGQILPPEGWQIAGEVIVEGTFLIVPLESKD